MNTKDYLESMYKVQLTDIFLRFYAWLVNLSYIFLYIMKE